MSMMATIYAARWQNPTRLPFEILKQLDQMTLPIALAVGSVLLCSISSAAKREIPAFLPLVILIDHERP